MISNPAESTIDSAGGETQTDLNIATVGSFPKPKNGYVLPTGSAEHLRLDLQHEAPKLVQVALSPTESHQRYILDVGTGSGRWAVEMSENFPNAKVLGIDTHLPSVLGDPSRPVPSNCSFKIADANCDMNNLDSMFDIIHQRCVEPGINDTDLFFYESARILRPGGVLLSVGANPQLIDTKGRILPIQKPGDVGYSHYQHMLGYLLEIHLKKGPFRIRHAFWKSMLESNPNYNQVKIEQVLVPLGPWPGMGETERKLAETMQQNLLRLWPTFKAILERDGGFSEEFVHNLSEGGLNELREVPPPVRSYSKWVFTMAVRNENPWTAQKEPWQEPPGFDMFDYFVRPLPKE
ncbi:hypothetical protein M407DRAFT_9322 [Tulasnella calospora MUT 4182]|uniref:Methyltransferase domain-containing protein n=1 Tax=Tulasnella calospora MUT 4182 TaxID=1051891 RepID=A0A0C3Q471_9AGAM|nr:hypothetical protein M407DRAFT_9322 [Tulasnella calospora MUT 4182]